MQSKEIAHRPDQPDQEEAAKELGPELPDRNGASYAAETVADLQRRVGNRAAYRILTAAGSRPTGAAAGSGLTPITPRIQRFPARENPAPPTTQCRRHPPQISTRPTPGRRRPA